MQVVRSTEPEDDEPEPAVELAEDDEPEPAVDELAEEDRLALRAQFVDVRTKAQESYDSSLRTFAAGGIAVTASIATALHTFGGLGTATIAAFLAALAAMQFSHSSTVRDMWVRVVDLESHKDHRLWGNRWTTITTVLNAAAGVAFFAGCVLLAVFVGVHS
jgi:hypothetical protein